MPEKIIFHKYIKTQIEVFYSYMWKSKIEIPLDESQQYINNRIIFWNIDYTD